VAGKRSIVQKRHTPEAAVVQNQTKLNRTKTRCFKIDWWIPALGIGLVAGFLLGASTYRGLQRQADEEVAFMPTLDRLCQDHSLSLVLKMLHNGSADQAEQRLDLLLCWDILRADAELASADAQTRAWTEDILRMIARARPKTPEGPAAGSTREFSEAQAAAQQLLERALTRDQIAQTR
jgi:hypothetical protein